MSTQNWSNYARYGDFLGAHLKSLRKFGYGMFVCRMQAAAGPTCSTFWMYSDAPSPGSMPEIAQLWRWNELDFEFVPQTQATQNAYITVGGSFPNPEVTGYGAVLDFSAMTSGQITPSVVSWTEGQAMSDDYVMGQMQQYYNKWMAGTGNPIAESDFNLTGAAATTGPNNAIGASGNGTSGNPAPGWPNADEWKYPLAAVLMPPSSLPMSSMLGINVFRTPTGQQSVQVSLPGYDAQTFDCILSGSPIGGSTASESYISKVLNNETFVLPASGSDFNPYTSLNYLTVVWLPDQISFYINADSGTDINNATPIATFPIDSYPSVGMSGTQAPQGSITWADTTLTDELGGVSINLANYVAFAAAANMANDQLQPSQYAGAGWSGDPPPESGWAGDDAYVRSVMWYPMVTHPEEPPTFNFDAGWGVDFGDGTWTADNFAQKITQYFGFIYASTYTNAGGASGDPEADFMSPMAVTFQPNSDGTIVPDKLPVLQIACTYSNLNPVRNFFFLNVNMNNANPISTSNPFMYLSASLGTSPAVPCIGFSGPSTPLAFYAPAPGASTTLTLSLYLSATYHGSFPSGDVPTSPNATATLTLSTDASGNILWSIDTDTYGIVIPYAPTVPYNITVQPGSAPL